MKIHLPLQVSQLRISCLFLFISLAISLSATAAPPVITVGHDPQACDFTDLQQAIDQAPDNAHIEMAAGVYLANHVDISGLPVWISGGHDGCGGDPLPDGRSILDADKRDHVMDLGAFEPMTVILERLEMRNGRGGPIGLGPSSGAGLRVFGPVNLMITDVVFRNNATLFGGGLDVNPGQAGLPEVTILRTDFIYNQADRSLLGVHGLGGAINCDRASISIQESTFFGNVAQVEGGAIYADECEIKIVDTVFDNNRATENGGAIYGVLSKIELGDNEGNSVSLTDNRSQSGGAVYGLASTFTMEDVLFAGNSADYGGGLGGRLSTLDLSHVRFEDNEAEIEGGAMYIERTPTKIFGVVAEGNTSIGHGAFLWGSSEHSGDDIEILSSVISGGEGKSQIYTRTDSKVRLLSSTVFNNPSLNPMLNMDDSESHVSHVIFAGNGGPPTKQDPDFFTCNFLDNFLNVPANSVMTFFGDPLFVDDHHIDPDSPAVDACEFGMFEAATEDLDGDLRPDAAGLNDIGADEVN